MSDKLAGEQVVAQIFTTVRSKRNFSPRDEEDFGRVQENLPIVPYETHDRENVVEAFRRRLVISAGRRGPNRHGAKYFAIYSDQIISGILDWRSGLHTVLK
jgi:hypothetical protein